MGQPKQGATSLVIGAEGYKQTLLYWGIISVVVVAFLVTTVTYWRGTIRVIDENTVGTVEVRRLPVVPDRTSITCPPGTVPQQTLSGSFVCFPPPGTPSGGIVD